MRRSRLDTTRVVPEGINECAKTSVKSPFAQKEEEGGTELEVYEYVIRTGRC